MFSEDSEHIRQEEDLKSFIQNLHWSVLVFAEESERYE